MTTLLEKNNTLVRLQCLHGRYGNFLGKQLKYGVCTPQELCNNTKSAFLIDVIRRYQVFDEEVTQVTKLIFDKPLATTNVEITILYDGIALAYYEGTGSLDVILNNLASQINNESFFPGYHAVIHENILYLYSYELEEAITTDVIEIDTFLDPVYNTNISVIDITSNPSEILELWNCISEKELCCIIKLLTNNLNK